MWNWVLLHTTAEPRDIQRLLKQSVVEPWDVKAVQQRFSGEDA